MHYFIGAVRSLLFVCGLVILLPGLAAKAATDAEIIRGFNLTVFGAEYSPYGVQSDYIRKFPGSVRFHIVNLAARNRVREVTGFIRSLNGLIRGIRTEIVDSPARANFIVYIVDRKDYVSVLRDRVYRRPDAATPGKCLVRSVFSPAGINRSDAVIVSDEGESLFQRCKVEEILQGLGPLNEDTTLGESMFNDRTRHTRMTKFDRLILNMLYDPRIRNGMSRQAVQPLLPQILDDAKRRVR